MLTNLMVYRQLHADPIVKTMVDLVEHQQSDDVYRLTGQLLEVAGGISPGEYLARKLVLDENAFTLAGEQRQAFAYPDLVEHDLALFCLLHEGIKTWFWEQKENFPEGVYKLLGRTTTDAAYAPLVALLSAKDSTGLRQAIFSQVSLTGTGTLGMAHAFVYEHALLPLAATDTIALEDLLGFEKEKEILCRNTEAFLHGKKALNALLYGERGTGKSSTVKALLNRYQHRGLKMIEVGKDHIEQLKSLLGLLRYRGGKYILFLDDLSFEDNETDYKSLKAMMQGELEEKTDNVLIYATSNRRHLIRENWADRLDEFGEIHRSDSMEEKLSLADRFGILLTYQHFSKQQFLDLVRFLARRHGLPLSEETLVQEALRFEMAGHGYSGRSAQQFVTMQLMQMSQEG